jgi:hypothetical protein
VIRTHLTNTLFWISLTTTLPAVAFFKVADTEFEEDFAGATTYPTKSLGMKLNFKTQDLNIGPYTGTWKIENLPVRLSGLVRKRLLRR